MSEGIPAGGGGEDSDTEDIATLSEGTAEGDAEGDAEAGRNGPDAKDIGGPSEGGREGGRKAPGAKAIVSLLEGI